MDRLRMREILRQRVSRGATVLDGVLPDWRDRVDPTTLNMGCERHCVIGQLTGDYSLAMMMMGGSPTLMALGGFTLVVDDPEIPVGTSEEAAEAFDTLTALWAEIITCGSFIEDELPRHLV